MWAHKVVSCCHCGERASVTRRVVVVTAQHTSTADGKQTCTKDFTESQYAYLAFSIDACDICHLFLELQDWDVVCDGHLVLFLVECPHGQTDQLTFCLCLCTWSIRELAGYCQAGAPEQYHTLRSLLSTGCHECIRALSNLRHGVNRDQARAAG